MKCSVQLVSHCFGDIVAGQVARNISQCNIPCNGQNLFETSCTNLILLSATAIATCLATILSVAGYVTSYEMFRATCPATMPPKHCEASGMEHFTVKLRVKEEQYVRPKGPFSLEKEYRHLFFFFFGRTTPSLCFSLPLGLEVWV